MRILVVEDEPPLRTTLATALRSCGHRPVEAEDGAEALAQVHATSPDLVLLDLQLPVMDGWEFLRRLRALPEFREMPVVVMSAAPHVVPAELDAQAFLPKPFDLDELLDVVDELLAEASGANSRDGPHSVGASP
jgi:two-component system response regulator MprA